MRKFALALTAAAMVMATTPLSAAQAAPANDGVTDVSSRHRHHHYGRHHHHHYGWHRGHHYGWYKHHRPYFRHYGWYRGYRDRW